MKNFKIFSIIAVAILIVGSAFTINKEQPTEKLNSLYWYVVTYVDGQPVIMSSNDFHTQDVKENVISPCDEGDNLDCLRGFTTPLTSFPNSSGGVDRIQKP